MLKKLSLSAIGLFMIITLAACGGSNGGSSAAQESNAENATPLEIVATDFEFDQAEYRVKAGEPIEFSIVNEQGIHGYEIEGLGIKVMNGETKQFTINEPGEYTIFCNIMCGTGHNDMKSKLIVE